MSDWHPGMKVTLCSLGHVQGPLTDEAREEIKAFGRHLQDHPRNAPVEGCRFCEARTATRRPEGEDHA